MIDRYNYREVDFAAYIEYRRCFFKYFSEITIGDKLILQKKTDCALDVWVEPFEITIATIVKNQKEIGLDHVNTIVMNCYDITAVCGLKVDNILESFGEINCKDFSLFKDWKYFFNLSRTLNTYDLDSHAYQQFAEFENELKNTRPEKFI